MKLHFFFSTTLFFICTTYIGQEIYPSNCLTADSAAASKYKNDAERLAVRYVNAQNVLYTDSIAIDTVATNRFYRALLAVYNATMIPTRDTVVTLYNIHTDLNPEMKVLSVRATPTLNWMQDLKNASFPTTNTLVNSIMSRFGLQFTYYQSTLYDQVVFTSYTNLNLKAMAQEFLSLAGVSAAELVGSFNDVTNITDSVNTNFIGLSYSIGWGTCEDTCDLRKHWNFKIYNNCSIEYLGTSGSPLFLSVRKFNFLNDITVFPNPTSNTIRITNNANEDLLYRIYNGLGQELYSETSNAKVYDIDIQHYPKGIYLLQLSAGGMITTKHIVKN